jgi:hypothetical protein
MSTARMQCMHTVLSVHAYFVFSVQACNQLPRHSSPFSHAAAGRPGPGAQSLWSDSSLERVIMNMTHKYGLTDSRLDLASSWQNLHHLTDTSAGLSSFFAHSDLPSLGLSTGNLTHSHQDLTHSHRDLTSSHGSRQNLTRSQRDLARSCQDLASSHRDLTQSLKDATGNRNNMSASQNNNQSITAFSRNQPGSSNKAVAVKDMINAQSEKETGSADVSKSGSRRNLAGSLRDLFRSSKSQANLGRSTTTTPPACMPAPPPRSKSAADLLSSRPAANEQHETSKADVNSLHTSRSGTNMHASSSSSHRPRPLRHHSQRSRSKRADGHEARERSYSSSSLSQKVTHYETSFGPQNQTVTRVFYCDGDCEEKAGDAPATELPPRQTAGDGEGLRFESTRINPPQTGGRSSSRLLSPGCSGLQGGAESSHYYSSQQERGGVSGVSCSTPYLSALEGSLPYIDGVDTRHNSPASPGSSQPPPVPRRSRTQRYCTFSGSQFNLDRLHDTPSFHQGPHSLCDMGQGPQRFGDFNLRPHSVGEDLQPHSLGELSHGPYSYGGEPPSYMTFDHGPHSLGDWTSGPQSLMDFDQCGSRGLGENDRRLSMSTPYLPGLRIDDSSEPSSATSLGARPRQFVSRSMMGQEAVGGVKRCSSMYMSCEYLLVFFACLFPCIIHMM